ncbi:MAG: hemagglutinin repeat-containing protein, partial [Burkholderiaceae bacterium]
MRRRAGPFGPVERPHLVALGDTAAIGHHVVGVTGPKVVADIGGNFKIESLQDSAQFDSKSQSARGSVTL